MLMHNLPAQPTAFVGRAEELANIAALLADHHCRLLTLVGQGGIGKTRLALQAAADQTAVYPHDVHVVSLQSVTSADLIPATIASALKIIFYGAEEPRLQIINFLREKHLLLVMDNFEHLLDATALLTDILAAAPRVKILTTSRERLNLQEEWAFTVEGLPFPDERTSESLETYSAVQLFVGRARQIQSTFSLKANAEAVKVICRQVEGMPLGIELAASWLRVMSCQQIVAQMAHSLEFLTTPLRNVPERHRSLRAVFEQSWNLLAENEQSVLMKLSVFRGGFDLEAAQAVAGASLIILASLADKSLIQLKPAGRYDLHELMRQYAADKLGEVGETSNTANQHLLYFVTLAELGEAHAYGSEQVVWYDRQEAEIDNLRAALAWSLSGEEIESGLRMAAALRWVWEMRGHLNEGLNWFEKLLSVPDGVSRFVHAKALHRACEVAGGTEHRVLPNTWAEEALKLARSINDKWNIAWSLSAGAHFSNDYHNLDQKAVLLEESLALFRELDDPLGLSHVLRRRAVVALNQDDYLYARELLEEALTDARKVADKNATAWTLHIKALLLWQHHQQVEQVIPLYQESISLFREIGDVAAVAYPLVNLAGVERFRRNYEQSRALFEETLRFLRSRGMDSHYPGILAIAGIGNLATLQGEFERAAKLMGAVHKLGKGGYFIPRYIYPDDTPLVRTRLGEEAFEKAWAEGRALSIDQAVAYALAEELLPTETITVRVSQPLVEPLTDREFEVLWLLADGLSNPQIAERLVVATGTIKAHTNNIFGKLNVNNRVQAVNRAKELNLL